MKIVNLIYVKKEMINNVLTLVFVKKNWYLHKLSSSIVCHQEIKFTAKE